MPFVRSNAKMSGTKSMCPTYLADSNLLIGTVAIINQVG